MSRRPIRPRVGAGALGGPLVHLDLTGSTNEDARRLAVAGAPAGTVVIAEQQTSGRGRQGRTWSAPRGSALTLSVLARDADGRTADLMPLAAAVAVCEACESAAPVGCRIKWPNDVLVDERKLAGILIESRPAERWAVIGIGVNVDTREEELGELREVATSLRIAGGGAAVDRDRLLDRLLERLATQLAQLQGGEGERVLAAYRARDGLDGRRIAWEAGERKLHGQARGIDDRGRLIVFTDGDERLALDAGEVHLGPT